MSRRSAAFFAQLRRDCAPFALVCTLILIADLLQPPAQAQAGEGGHAWTICSNLGAATVAPEGTMTWPGALAHVCPLCVAGGHCGALAPKFAVSAAVFAFLDALDKPAPAIAFLAQPDQSGGPPPPIRAPPLFA
jgi:hypothetical protein